MLRIRVPVVLTLLLIGMFASACASKAPPPYELHTTSDIDAKIACAVSISKAEFYAGKLGVFGTPRVCQGVKATELDKWACVSQYLDQTRNFATATNVCQGNRNKE